MAGHCDDELLFRVQRRRRSSSEWWRGLNPDQVWLSQVSFLQIDVVYP